MGQDKITHQDGSIYDIETDTWIRPKSLPNLHNPDETESKKSNYYIQEFSKESIKQHLDLSFKSLNYKQILTLCWWELFNRKKLDLFFDGLNKGKSPIYAYKDAKQYYNETYKK